MLPRISLKLYLAALSLRKDTLFTMERIFYLQACIYLFLFRSSFNFNTVVYFILYFYFDLVFYLYLYFYLDFYFYLFLFFYLLLVVDDESWDLERALTILCSGADSADSANGGDDDAVNEGDGELITIYCILVLFCLVFNYDLFFICCFSNTSFYLLLFYLLWLWS